MNSRLSSGESVLRYRSLNGFGYWTEAEEFDLSVVMPVFRVWKLWRDLWVLGSVLWLMNCNLEFEKFYLSILLSF